jgi:hypothetical protein
MDPRVKLAGDAEIISTSSVKAALSGSGMSGGKMKRLAI